MPLYNYFSKLGTTDYNGDIVNNIITSIRFKDFITDNNIVFYPYTIEEGERPDTIAANYYGDSRYAWVVLLCNQYIDPYYEWPLTTNEFSDFILKKYGSVAAAEESVAFYRNNWYGDDSMLSVTAYEALPSSLKKYWNPVVGYTGTIGSYERKRVDYILETNKIIQLTISSTTNIAEGDKLIQRTSGAITGTGFVSAVTSTSVIVRHITGSFAATAGSVGNITNTDGTVSRSVSDVLTLNTPIPAVEAAYWEQVSQYTYENELNESKKTIQLLDVQFLSSIEDQMIDLLA